MHTEIDRRRLLTGAAALLGGVAVGSGLLEGEASAAIPTVGSLAVPRLWGYKNVKVPDPNKRGKFIYVKQAVTKNMYEGTAVPVLNTGGLCHWEGTPNPGQKGNSVLFGHRTAHGGPLNKIHTMKRGDQFNVVFKGQPFVYTVTEEGTVITSKDFAKLLNWGNPNQKGLTFVACTKQNKLPTDTRWRLIVRAVAA